MKKITMGLAGGYGGKEFEDYSVPAGAKINEIHVFSDKYINALQIVCTDSKGKKVSLPRVGGLGGKEEVFSLDADENIVGISGKCGWYIDSLQIRTNKKISDTFGGQGGDEDFNYEVPKGHELTGLYGRADWHLDAIGILTQKATPQKKRKSARKSGTSDLQKVEGIGPKIARILTENGIRDLADLSRAKVSTLKNILKKAGKRYALADPGTWAEQAKLGARGDWDAMEKLKEKLNKGKRVE